MRQPKYLDKHDALCAIDKQVADDKLQPDCADGLKENIDAGHLRAFWRDDGELCFTITDAGKKHMDEWVKTPEGARMMELTKQIMRPNN